MKFYCFKVSLHKRYDMKNINFYGFTLKVDPFCFWWSLVVMNRKFGVARTHFEHTYI